MNHCAVGDYKVETRKNKRTIGKVGSKKSNDQDDVNRKYVDIKVIVVFFKIIGLAPFNCANNYSVGRTSDKPTDQIPVIIKFVHSRLSFIYTVFIVVANLLMSVIGIKHLLDSSYELKTSFTLISDLVQAVSGISLMNGLWLLTSTRRNHIVRVLNRLVKVHFAIHRLSNSQRSGISRLHVIGVFILLTILMIALVISDSKAYNAEFLDWFTDILPIFITVYFVLQYALMVKFLEIEYRNLNNAIIDLSRFSTIRTFRSFALHGEIALTDCDYFPKIIDFRRAHNTLYEIGWNIAEFYSLPILFILTLSCFGIVYNAYFGLMPLTLSIKIDPTYIVTCSIAWVLILIIPIVILAKGVDSINNEIRKTPDAVYKMLDGSNLGHEDRTELEQFCIELLHRKINFTAYGLFPLDCSLVHSIFSSTITYLVILLQFQISARQPENPEKK